VAKDFFSLGQDQPIFRAFSVWVEKGYQILSSKRNPQVSSCSWRFWAKGSKKHALVCGLLKDSCDLIGRRYPLLVMGTGSLEGWEDHWDLLPLSCERSWSQIEYLSAKKHKKFEHLENDLRLSRPPNSRWNELAALRNAPKDSGPIERARSLNANFVGIESEVRKMAKENEILVPLKDGTTQDLFGMINLSHHLLRSHLSAIPNAVFMGGGPDANYLVAFIKALGPNDFIRLWSVCSEDVSVQRPENKL
jgi:type VI secretion system protein VasJ